MDPIQGLIDRINWACSKIIKVKNETLDIIRSSTIANIRSIERNSRSVKDPNPLMSTMTNINLKYPITVRRDGINTEDVPDSLILKSEDNRRHNRILCKKDLVSWYINSKVETKEEDESVKKLFDSNLKKFEKIFAYKWEDVKFKIGAVNISRNLVSVNPNDFDIPKELIKPAILHSLGLSNLIDYNEVPDYYLNQIKSLVDSSNLDVRKVPNMLNYLQNHLDKRMRYLPVLPGMTPEFVYMSHALVQPNFRVENVMEEASQQKGQNKSITEACINLIRHCQIQNIPYHKIREMIGTIKINDYPMNKILETTDENKFTRFIKGIMGLQISPTIERDGVSYFPSPTRIYETVHENLSGTQFKRLNGEETVYFETQISKGFFVHNGDALLTVTINRTTFKELVFVLSNIAVFITKDFEMTRGKSVKVIRTEIKKKYQTQWPLLVGVNTQGVRSIKAEIASNNMDDREVGSLRFSSNIETQRGEGTYCVLKEGSLINAKNGQLICVAPVTSGFIVLDLSIKISDPTIYYLMHPYRILTKAIQYNLSIVGNIKKDIRNGIFQSVFYEHIEKFIPISQRKRVSENAQIVLRSLMDSRTTNNLYIAALYCFAFGKFNEASSSSNITEFMFYKEKVFFNLRSGLIKVTFEGDLMCNNEVVVRSNRLLDDRNITCTMLPDYEIRRIPSLIRGVPTKSISWLKKNTDNLPDGYRVVTIFQTHYYLMTKKKGMDLQIQKTLKRYINIGVEEETTNMFSRYLLKRRMNDIEEESSGSSSEKRRKMEDAMSMIL